METPFSRAVKSVVVSFLYVVLRLSRSSEQSYEFLGEATHAKILSDKNLFTLPQLLDILCLYGHSNKDLMQRMVNDLFKGALAETLQLESQFGMCTFDMLESLTAATDGLKTTSKSLGGEVATNGNVDHDLKEDDLGAFALDSCVVIAMVFDFFPPGCKDIIGAMEEVGEQLWTIARCAIDTTSSRPENLYKFAGKALGGWVRVFYGPMSLHGQVDRADKRLDELHQWVAGLMKEEAVFTQLRPYCCFGIEALLTDWLGAGFVREERLKSVAKEAKIDWQPVRVEGSAADVVSGGMSSQILQLREILGATGEKFDDGFLQEVLKSFHGNLQQAIVSLMHPEGEGLPDHLKFLLNAKEVKLLDKDKQLRDFWADPSTRGAQHAKDKAITLERAEEIALGGWDN